MRTIDFRENQEEWKGISVLMPAQEIRRIDEMAKQAGLNRSSFIRLRLKENIAFLPTEKIEELIVALHHIEQIFDRYLDILEEFLQLSRETWQEDSLSRLEEEIKRAEMLMDLTYRAQKQAVQLIRNMRKKASAPINH